jgi:hypothetical protein
MSPTGVVLGRGVGSVAVMVWIAIRVWGDAHDRRAIRRNQRLLAIWNADAAREGAFRRFVDEDVGEPTNYQAPARASALALLAVMFAGRLVAR